MRRKPKPPLNLALVDTAAAADILALRRAEEGNRERSTLQQWRENRLAGLYGRHVFVDGTRDPGTWGHKQRIPDPLNPGQFVWVVRHGARDRLPPRRILQDKTLRDFEVAADVADALIERDGGWTEPGEPI